MKTFNSANKPENGSNHSLGLVVWGKNLESGIGNGRVTKLHSQMYELAPYQLSVVVGVLLSDGWLSFAIIVK